MARLPIIAVFVCTLSGVSIAQSKSGTGAPDVPVARVGDQTISLAELDTLAKDRLTKLRNEEYVIRKQVLDEHVARLLIEKEAAARNLTVGQLTRAEIEAKVAPVTSEQTRAVLESRGPRPSGQHEAQALAQIESSLRQARQAEARRRFVDELRIKFGVSVLLDIPRASLGAGPAPSRGPAGAAVTIVEFSDFQCPYCRQATQTLRQLEERYGTNLRIVYRDFPLPMHKDAPKAAEAAACAYEQGRFWAMHDKLFENQSRLQVPDLKRYAVEIGLEATRFDECLDSGRTEPMWQQNRSEGQRYGVSATPTFFINGRMVTGALPIQSFSEIIDDELARLTKTTAR